MYVPTGVTDSFFEGMVLLVLATNQGSFSDDELPPQEMIILWPCKCEDMIVARVLINNGLALNVNLMATLEYLKVDLSLIRPGTMIIRAFDGTHREVHGEIELMIEIGIGSFMVNFQVIKVDSLYNMLLGRP